MMMIMFMQKKHFAILLIAVVVQLCTVSASLRLVSNDALQGIDAAIAELSADGLTMIVASTKIPNATVYQRTNIASTWMQIGPVISITGPYNGFFINLGMSLDGTVVAVSGTQMIDVYKLNMSSTNIWEKVGATLVSPKTERNRIEFSADGSTMIVGRIDSGNLNGGEVSVYKFSGASNQWEILGSPLKGNPPDTDRSFPDYTTSVDLFGDGVGISSDGTIITITAYTYETIFTTKIPTFRYVSNVNTYEFTNNEWTIFWNHYDASTKGVSLSTSAQGNFLFKNTDESVQIYQFMYSLDPRRWELIFELSQEPKGRRKYANHISSDGKVILFRSGPAKYTEQDSLYVYQLNERSNKYEQIVPDVDFCFDGNNTCSYSGFATNLAGDGRSLVFSTWIGQTFGLQPPALPDSMVTYILDDGVVITPMKHPTQTPIKAPTEQPTNAPKLPTQAPIIFPTNSPSLPPSNYFTIVDANTDITIGLLESLIPTQPNTIDYSLLNTSSVSIVSIFPSPNVSDVVKSVYMTLDSPSRKVCRNNVPYALFGTMRRGNIKGLPLTLGERRVTATAYTSKNCTGKMVGTLSQSFRVRGCNTVQFKLYDAKRDSFVLDLGNVTNILSPPCKASIGVTFQCGFQPDNVVFTLWNASNNVVPMFARKEKVAPYFMFGDDNRGNIYPGTIPTGKYMLTIAIDGIIHPSIQFTLLNACV